MKRANSPTPNSNKTSRMALTSKASLIVYVIKKRNWTWR